MSLAQLLASQDEAALIALSSKGLVKRAQKDVQAGAVTITSRDDRQAECNVLGETVNLVGKSMSDARCTCTALGICRHILSAVLTLREGTPEAKDMPEAIVFDIATVKAFAGNDWAQACAIAELGVVPESAGSIVVTFPKLEASATFSVGSTLRDAIYKGPVAAHKRRIIAAAALAVLQGEGTALPEVIAEQAVQGIDPALLDTAAEALETAAVGLAAGTLSQARELLFAIAIESRVDKAPRLAAELRGLSKVLTEDTLRDARSTPTDILCRIAKTRALVDALRKAPTDPILVGQLRRSFTPSGPRSLAFLGGASWQTDAGARGLTLYFSDLNTGLIYHATEARAAGTDVLFQPEDRWKATVWGLAAPAQLAGQRIAIGDAAVSFDNGLSLSQSATFDGAIGLQDQPQVITDWTKLEAEISMQMGIGLRRRRGRAHMLVAPDQLTSIAFDEVAQKHVWTWLDTAGCELTLGFAEGQGLEQHLSHLDVIKAGLIAIDPQTGDAQLLSVWLDDKRPISLGLERFPGPKRSFVAKFSKLTQRLRSRQTSTTLERTAHLLFFERMLESLLQAIVTKSSLPPNLVNEGKALAQNQVSGAIDAWEQEKTLSHALALAYILSIGRDLSERLQRVS